MKFRILLAVLLCAPSALALPISGRVRVTGRAAGVNATTIVYAELLDGTAAVKKGKFSIAQKDKAFIPHILAIPAGSTVDFPNKDLIFHNVFSLSRPEPFDLGLYENGDSRSRTFTKPATYRVFCNIHPQMAAVILVLPTSFIAEADAAGNYRLDLPAGHYRLTAWSEHGQSSSIEVSVGPGSAPPGDLALDESKATDGPHKNKFGEDYPKAVYDTKKP